MIVLPGPILLADPLPDGWRRCSSLGCGAPAGHDGEHVPEAVPPLPLPPALPREERQTARPVAGVTCAACRASEDCEGATCPCACHDDPPLDERDLADEIIERADPVETWTFQWRRLVEADPSTLTSGGLRRRAAMLAIAAHVRETPPTVTTAERIEAVAVGATRSARIEAAARAVIAVDGCGCDAPPCCVACEAYRALRAALCTCTGHGPDLACPEHGEALRKWQAREVP